MSVLDLFWHLGGLLAPALVLAPGMVLGSRLLARTPARLRWPWQLLIQWLAGSAVLVAGLVWTGEDGRMATYAALVLVLAACQAWMSRP